MGKMRYGFCLGAAALACAWSGISTPAHAQGAPTSGIPMFDSITSMGQQMGQNGIYFNLGYVEDFSRLSGGGRSGGQGWYPIGHANAGVTFDLETIAGIPGASFHVIFEERNGLPFGNGGATNPAGNDIPLQADAGPTKYRLSEFYWEQGFDHDRIDIQVGRTSPTLEFGISDISCVFVASIICAQPGTWYFENNNGAYPAVEWGGRVNLAVTPEIYIKVGIYDDDPSNTGFMPAGFNWNTSHSTGVFSIGEIGYLTGFSAVQLPAKYDAGFYYDTSHYTVGSQPNSAGVQGQTAGYIQLQQTVWRPEMSTHQSLTLFGGAQIYSGTTAYRGQYYAGLYDRAPFGAARPNDSIGLIGTLADINQGATVDPSTISLAHPHGVGAPFSREWVFEANYGIGIVPGVTAKPYVQYVLQPFTQSNPTQSLKNDVVFGVQLTVVFEQLFNFPVFVPH